PVCVFHKLIDVARRGEPELLCEAVIDKGPATALVGDCALGGNLALESGNAISAIFDNGLLDVISRPLAFLHLRYEPCNALAQTGEFAVELGQSRVEKLALQIGKIGVQNVA